MGIVIFVMGTVIAVFMSMLVGGLMLPARHATTRSIRLRATPDAVWALIADPAGYPAWHDAITSVDIEGRAPLRWREYGDDGALAFEVSTVQPPLEFRVHGIDDDVARRAERAYLLSPIDGGTRLEYVEHVTVSNPIARFFFRFVLKRNAGIDRMLMALGNALGETALPGE